MSREPTIDRQGVKYQRTLATQIPGASGLCLFKESNSKKGGAKLNRKTNIIPRLCVDNGLAPGGVFWWCDAQSEPMGVTK
jgi:hypothetical protein